MDTQTLIVKNLKKERKAAYTVRVLPWFMGGSNDLMFYIAINTLFFTAAKGLSAAQITLLTTVSGFACILLQRPFLAIIHKIGNTRSVRLGTLLLLAGSILLTFGPSYPFILAGHICYTCSFLFKSMDNVMLQSNLDYLEQHDGYLRQKNKASIIYSAVTTVVALAAGPLFKVHTYLPMYLCIAVCLLNVIISFTLADVDEKPHSKRIKEAKKGTFGKLVLFIILAYGLFYAIVATGQSNVKLLIQYQLSDFFDVGTTATYFSVILVLSRISRIISNLCFYQLYKKCRDQLLFLLPIVCGIAFASATAGYFVLQMQLKFILLTFGFCIILGIRDLFNTYMNHLAMKKTAPEEHQSCVSYMQLSRRVGDTVISFLVSLLLMKVEIIWAIFMLVGFVLIALMMNMNLYKKIRR